MAEAVVHRLEVVEVDEQHRHARIRLVGVGQRRGDLLGEQRAVGELGETVVGCLVRQLAFELAELVEGLFG